VIVEVDVDPPAPGLRGLSDCDPNQLGADTPPLAVGADLRVNQERVVPSVPGHIHEADQRAAAEPRRHPAEAVRPDLIPPPRL
jgi:hypothetical protein